MIFIFQSSILLLPKFVTPVTKISKASLEIIHFEYSYKTWINFFPWNFLLSLILLWRTMKNVHGQDHGILGTLDSIEFRVIVDTKRGSEFYTISVSNRIELWPFVLLKPIFWPVLSIFITFIKRKSLLGVQKSDLGARRVKKSDKNG